MTPREARTVSVVVPTHQRRELLEEVLAPLLADAAAHEVIVVADGCHDGTQEMIADRARAEPRLRLLETPGVGENGARQAGVEVASGDIVLLIDDDVIASPGLVAGHAEAHGRAPHLVVIGHMPVRRTGALGVGERLYAQWYEARVADYVANPDAILHNLWAGNVSLPRADALAVGIESDYAGRYNADRDLGLRLHREGLHGRYDPALAAEHRYRRPLAAVRRDARNSGPARLEIHRRHGDIVGPFAADGFEDGLPPVRRLVVRASRRPALGGPLEAVASASTRVLDAVAPARVADAAGSLLVRIVQQRAAVGREPAPAREPLPVSVVIPAYERPEMVARAVASALAQTRAPAEVVVVDDCSGDQTAAAAEAAGARVIRHERNRGEGAARNSGIEAATQPWVALLDSDDEWLPGHLETLWAMHEGVVLAASTCVGRSDHGDERLFGNTGRARRLRSPATLVFPANVVAPSAVMLRREDVLAVGGFDSGLHLCADLDLWLKVLERGEGASSPAVTVVYHLHEGQVSSDLTAMRRAHVEVAERYRDRPWFRAWRTRAFTGSVALDDLRPALRRRDWSAVVSALAGTARDPWQLVGLGVGVWWRARVRRATTRWSAGDQPGRRLQQT